MRLQSILFSVTKTLRSFRYAWHGIYLVIRYENNTRVHLLASVVAVVAGVVLGLNPLEWALILMQIGLVWAAETFNTALEKLVDLVSPEYHPLAGKVKDIAAGAVLIVSLMSVAVGGIILGSRVYAWWGRVVLQCLFFAIKHFLFLSR
jgi:diacylglycerol kinase